MWKGGFAGKILRVDLSSGLLKDEPLKQDLALNYLGGTGFAARFLFDMVGPEVDPFSDKNVLVFASGVLVGTLFPQASRHVIAAKSPLTEIYGEAHAAGFISAELKFSGYDAIIIQGRSERPVYLCIY
ncbi:MAG: aldehyde ferredoxin oxidoreductase N-terminal domain-containing protein, partial [Candidatus Methanodesulfokora sp.]